MALERQPLRDLYDWTTFQRQMNYAGWGLQLGGYIPHTSLTALPMVPLAPLAPMTAKRVWLAFSVACFAAAIWMLAKITRLPAAGLILLALAGHNALAGNLELGRYYFFLLFLMTIGIWLLLDGRHSPPAFMLGAILILKLYAGPFLIYFAWKRRWRALAGMLLSATALALLSIAWFGWTNHLYYVTDILPRAIAGEHIDPYAPGMPTILNMLRQAIRNGTSAKSKSAHQQPSANVLPPIAADALDPDLLRNRSSPLRHRRAPVQLCLVPNHARPRLPRAEHSTPPFSYYFPSLFSSKKPTSADASG